MRKILRRSRTAHPFCAIDKDMALLGVRGVEEMSSGMLIRAGAVP